MNVKIYDCNSNGSKQLAHVYIFQYKLEVGSLNDTQIIEIQLPDLNFQPYILFTFLILKMYIL